MPLYQVVVLALVQGFTEFLPVSSTAHLYLTSWLLGWDTQSLQFDIMLHLGTLVAVLAYFLRDWVQIICDGFGIPCNLRPEFAHNRKLLWLLVLGTVPAAVCGALFNDYAETVWRTPWVMGGMLIAIGAVMWVADARRGKRKVPETTVTDALTVGIAQVLALVPGCSRSGITMSAGLFRGMDRGAAARFSFLLSTPVIGGAALKALWDVHKSGGMPALLNANFAIGLAVSALSGLAVIAWFLRYLRDAGLRSFVYYRVIFGIIVLALAFIRRPA